MFGRFVIRFVNPSVPSPNAEKPIATTPVSITTQSCCNFFPLGPRIAYQKSRLNR